jgi:RNA polymerase sigma-70 factor (ECF subfamily)
LAPRLHRWFLQSAGSDAVAQDMVQATFLHAHRARADFQHGRPFRPWLFTIAANVRRQHFRRKARKPEAPLDDGVREPSVPPSVSTPRQRAVRRALEDLKEGHREVVYLHWFEGFSFAEIAGMIGVSHSAVKVRAHRAYKVLRQALGDPA